MHLPENTLLQGGKYRIVRFIGSGGFGCTYEALHVMLEKRVAIKEFFVKDYCNRDGATSRVTVGTFSKKGLVEKLRCKFIDEAKSLCRLQHRGIVQVSDVFEENGTAYFVMDYIEGRSLGDMVRQEGALSEQRALKYIRQVADALQYVHGHNRLHLDIKPDNIMVDGNDRAILIDFGASKQYDEVDGENTSTLMGKTPGYAPLEQMGNDVVKFLPATDIYALGATLYKLLTGVTPPSSSMLACGEELASFPSFISVSTRRTVFSAMMSNKNKRTQTVEVFLDALNEQKTVDDYVTVIETTKVQECPKSEAKSTSSSSTLVDDIKVELNNNGEGRLKKVTAFKYIYVCLIPLLFVVCSSIIYFRLSNCFGYVYIDLLNEFVHKDNAIIATIITQLIFISIYFVIVIPKIKRHF